MNLSFSKTLAAKAHVAVLVIAAAVPSARAGDICVAEKLAAASGWHLNWVVQLPFDTDRTQLESLSIGDGLVVATSGDGRVHAYRESPAPLPGTLAWSQRIGHAADPGLPAQVGPSLVLATRGRNLYSFDRETGDRLWADHLGRMPNAPAVEGDNWVYVPFGPLRVLRLTAYPTGRTRAMLQAAARATDDAVAAENAKLARRRAALEDHAPLLVEAGTARAKAIHRLAPYSVGWIGEEGMLVTLNDLENGWRRHELRLGSLAAGDLVHRNGSIWVALSSGDVIRVDSDPAEGLSVAWRAALPAMPTSQLLIDGDTLLVSLGEWGIEARSASSGDLLWSHDQPVHLLSAGGGMAWWFDAARRLVLTDLADGHTLTTLQPGRFQMPITNTVSDHLYLATTNGVVASLAPTAPSAAPLQAAPEEVPAAAEQPVVPAPAANDDPFGGSSDDPFGTGSPADEPGEMNDSDDNPFGGDDPFGTPPAAADDPFTFAPRNTREPA